MSSDGTAGRVASGYSAIAQYRREHHIRFVLFDSDGTEIMDIEPEHVRAMADSCHRAGRGYVGQVAIRLDSIPAAFPTHLDRQGGDE